MDLSLKFPGLQTRSIIFVLAHSAFSKVWSESHQWLTVSALYWKYYLGSNNKFSKLKGHAHIIRRINIPARYWLQEHVSTKFLTSHCAVFFFSQTKKGFCSKFHSLPFAARVAVFSVVALIGIGTLSCCLWVFCCKPPASGKKIDLKDFEDKFEYDGEFEAPALEQKLPIEKQKLVIDA